MYPCSLSLMIALLIGPLRGEPTKKGSFRYCYDALRAAVRLVKPVHYPDELVE